MRKSDSPRDQKDNYVYPLEQKLQIRPLGHRAPACEPITLLSAKENARNRLARYLIKSGNVTPENTISYARCQIAIKLKEDIELARSFKSILHACEHAINANPNKVSNSRNSLRSSLHDITLEAIKGLICNKLMQYNLSRWDEVQTAIGTYFFKFDLFSKIFRDLELSKTRLSLSLICRKKVYNADKIGDIVSALRRAEIDNPPEENKILRKSQFSLLIRQLLKQASGVSVTLSKLPARGMYDTLSSIYSEFKIN